MRRGQTKNPSFNDDGGDTAVTVWDGTYRFSLDDPFFKRVVKTGQKYADQKARGRQVSAPRFSEEMEALRSLAPTSGRILLDELEHRWARPEAPPSLYVVSFSICVPGRSGQAVRATKVGQAERSLAPRLSVYASQRRIQSFHIADGPLTLRAVFYGHGPRMMLERDIQAAARQNGSRLGLADETGALRWVGSETYVGTAIINPICRFARQRAQLAV